MRGAKEKPIGKGNRYGAQPLSPVSLSPRENAALFIYNLPKMESHYCRKSISKVYLEPLFQSQQQLYRMYVENCKSEEKDFVSRFTFSNLLSKKNVALFQPIKVQCDMCEQHKVGQLSDEELGKHMSRKERARAEKQKDKDEALADNCSVLTADFQAVKLAPFLKASALYYKTKLCVHNYTIYNLKTHSVVCSWWNKSEGGTESIKFYFLLSLFPERDYEQLASRVSKSYRHLDRWLWLPEEEQDFGQCPVKSSNRRELYITTEILGERDHGIPLTHCYSSIRPGNKVSAPTVHDVVHHMYSPNGKTLYKLNLEEELKELPSRSKASEGARSTQCS
ncbi:hypothetical protein PR048_001975 [Dryococelus australis]|uniref:Uncharacterized protein n=1 Tax=Dryococelus australis TaxID=614101 RepID=A0ABQ9IJY7_9NEOP|nr:hypothetical protein PR048_001975 [Dryococelus australis]